MKYIFFTFYHVCASVARKLIEEGNTVLYAEIQDISELKNNGEEDDDKKKERLSFYDGLLQKHDAKEVLKKMQNIKNKDEWFVIFDFNTLWRYSEAVMKMGFKNGFFPTREQFELEEDRDKGKEFVKKNYPNLNVAEVHEFQKVDEGIQFLEQDTSGNIYVLKSYDGDGSTVVPSSEDPELAKEEIKGALELEQKDYEKKGYILEQKILKPLEITPEALFYNGKLVATNVDIENKPIGAGSTGNMTGCAGNLVIKTDLKDKINEIAFPQAVYDMAAKHPGLFVWDASILIDEDTGKLYFGEFCANRFGYDALFTEISMCDSVSSYFESLMNGENPYKKTFGVGVRMFNLKTHKDVPIIFKDKEDGIFMYDARLQDDKFVSIGESWDLLVANASDDNPDKAVEKCYNLFDKVSFSNGYYRPKFDFLSTDYQNSILNRFNYANHKFFEVADFKASDKKEKVKSNEYYKSKFSFISSQHQKSIDEMLQELDSMRNSHDVEIKKIQEDNKSKLDILKVEIKNALNDK